MPEKNKDKSKSSSVSGRDERTHRALTSLWEQYRDVIYIALFVAIIILILVLFDYNYRLSVVVSYLWNSTCPTPMAFR